MHEHTHTRTHPDHKREKKRKKKWNEIIYKKKKNLTVSVTTIFRFLLKNFTLSAKKIALFLSYSSFDLFFITHCYHRQSARHVIHTSIAYIFIYDQYRFPLKRFVYSKLLCKKKTTTRNNHEQISYEWAILECFALNYVFEDDVEDIPNSLKPATTKK